MTSMPGEDQALAVEPILGSQLLDAAHQKEEPRCRASTGCTILDEAVLLGGFGYGDVNCLCAANEEEHGRDVLILHTIASHLLSSPPGLGSNVAIIDTQGTFSPARLRDVLSSRLYTNPPHQSSSPVNPTEQALRLLDRVKIMRVFDLPGIAEAVSEISTISSLRPSARSPTAVAPRTPQSERREISDSEADSSPSSVSASPSPPPSAPESNKIGFVLVHPLHPVASHAISRSSAQGHALLSSLMRSLALLSDRHRVCCVVTNVLVPARPGEDNWSVFASAMYKPALGRAGERLADAVFNVRWHPRDRVDARVKYREGGTDWSGCWVLECARDRYGEREGRWKAWESMGNGTELKAI